MTRILRTLSVLAACLLAAWSARAFPASSPLYTTPSGNPYIEFSGDSEVTVADSSGSIATAQAALNSAYTANPGAIIILQLTGTYTVTSAPLVLSSNTCLVLEAHTVIQAGSGATAAALIQVNGQSDVAIAGGTLNGNGAALNAIEVLASNRVEVDQVAVANCGADGISLTGNGNSSYDNELAVTRCSVSGCSGNGIKVASGTQCVVIDNHCSGNTGAGISLSTARSTAANNTCSGNGTGIAASGSYVKVSDNTVSANGTGISLASGGSNNLAASNSVTNNTSVGIVDAGSTDILFQNVFSGNSSDFSGTGSGGRIFAWKSAISSPGTDGYFYPPLIDNPHSLTTIVSGMGRTDVTIGSDTLDDVQTQYNSAVSAHPGNVIVLHLTGTYSVGANPLNLGSNTVVLLSGTIQESSASTSTNAITLSSGATNVAISGGTVDGGGLTTTINGINGSNGNGVWIHATTVQNFGVPATRNGASNGLIKFSSMQGPAFVSSCTVNESGTRGIWTEGFGPYVITDNTSSNHNMDGVDCDFTTQEALVKFNTANGNTRHGIFIEQEATYNTVYGNSFSSNASKAIALFNNAEPTADPVAYNTCFCNATQGNPASMSNGASGTGSPVTSHNFFLNNRSNSDTDGIDSSGAGTQNYYSQSVLTGDTTPIITAGSEAFFNPTPAPAAVSDPSFSPGGGTYGTTQSVTISTATVGASIRYTTNGSTPSETAGTLYSGAVMVSATTTLKAIAYLSGAADSDVVSAVYTIQTPAASPTFSPGAGTYSSAQSVAISSTTPGASIRYTTDGSTPSETAGTLYSGAVTVGASETLKAIAYESGYTDSAVSSAAYTITLPQAAAPTFSPGAGTYSSAQSVTIASTTTGASIRYTTDGSTPSETAGTLYSGAVTVSASETLKAIAYKTGYTDSAVSSAAYTISGGGGQVAAPTFSPAGGVYTSAQSVTISSTTTGATIRYTTDGSTPSETAGTVYTGAVAVSGAMTLNAIAYESGFTDSTVTSAVYTAGATTFEAENQTVAATSGDTYSINSESGYSGGKAIQYNGAGVGDYLTLRLANVAAGTYDVVVGYKRYTTRATVQVSAGTAGGSLGNVGSAFDQYGTSAYTSVDLGNWSAATAGSQDFKFAVTGKNASSSGYTFTIDYLKLTPVVANSNIAPSGTAYGWYGMSSSTATTNQNAKPGLNDNNLTTDVDLDSAGDSVGAWEGAGVIWSSAKTITSADFINGTITSGGDGFLTAGLTVQYTTNGTTWTGTGWTVSPSYPYSSSAGGATYTATGTSLSGVLGLRFVGQVRTTDTSYHWIVKEVQVTGH